MATTDMVMAVGVIYLSIFLSLQQFFNFDRWVHKVVPCMLLFSVIFYRFQYDQQPLNLLDYLLTYGGSLSISNGIQDLIALYILWKLYIASTWIYHTGRFLTTKKVVNSIGGFLANFLKSLPILSKYVTNEISKIEESIGDLFHDDGTYKNYVLPTKGMSDDVLLAKMTQWAQKEERKWQEGYCSGAVYHGEQQHLSVLNQAAALYSVSNPLHADLWPSVRKYEAEVISMTAGLVNGRNENVCGVMTSGGTESIVLATKAHREWFRKEKGITQPEIIAGVTAHAAIDKACDLLGISLIKLPVDPVSYKMIVSDVRHSISANTIMIYASAPNFPQGIIDDIEALSHLAKSYDVGLHVDCCLGGFILPFARRYMSLPTFDFRLPGVTSMSCDTHKYGYASKGTSVVLSRDQTIRRYQYFCFPEWTGGLYATPTIAGSRPGALSAACWAAMMRLGEEGYISRTSDILNTAQEIRQGIDEMDGIYVLGDPKVMVICFGSKIYNILRIGDFMTKKGWNLNSLQHPACIHICVTLRHIGKASKFLADLEASIQAVSELPPGEKDSKATSAIYGMADTMPAGPVDDILRVYTDYSLTV